MTGVETGRLIKAGILAMILHSVVLSWQLHQDKVLSQPRSLAMQRITVSLGTSPMTVERPREPEPQPEKVREILPPPKPEPLPEPKPEDPARRPVKKTVSKSVAKPQPLQKHKVTSPPLPSLPAPENGESKTPLETASRVIQEASPLYQVNPPPKYPRLARRRGFEGVVILKAFIDVTGKIKKVYIFTSSGHSILDRSALKAVRRWQFIPGTVNGRPEEMLVKVPVRFQLKER